MGQHKTASLPLDHHQHLPIACGAQTWRSYESGPKGGIAITITCFSHRDLVILSTGPTMDAAQEWDWVMVNESDAL